jgi:hypothetical protein
VVVILLHCTHTPGTCSTGVTEEANGEWWIVCALMI